MLSDADKEAVDTKAEAKEGGGGGVGRGGIEHSAVMLLVFGLPVQVGIEKCQLSRSQHRQLCIQP